MRTQLLLTEHGVYLSERERPVSQEQCTHAWLEELTANLTETRA